MKDKEQSKMEVYVCILPRFGWPQSLVPQTQPDLTPVHSSEVFSQHVSGGDDSPKVQAWQPGVS